MNLLKEEWRRNPNYSVIDMDFEPYSADISLHDSLQLFMDRLRFAYRRLTMLERWCVSSHIRQIEELSVIEDLSGPPAAQWFLALCSAVGSVLIILGAIGAFVTLTQLWGCMKTFCPPKLVQWTIISILLSCAILSILPTGIF